MKLFGFNTNITYKGNIYHIQTEDNGINNPVITTFLYLKGTIIASEKTSYADMLNDPDYKEKVRKLLKEQHKGMIKELLDGTYTEDKTEETKTEDTHQ